MKTATGWLALFQIFIYIMVIVYIINFVQGCNKAEKKSEAYLGKPFVINRDTLIITDYSLLFQNYTLSDGTKVHYKLIENEE